MRVEKELSVNTEHISLEAKIVIIKIIEKHGMKLAEEVSGKSQATWYRWKKEFNTKEFVMPTTKAELDKLPSSQLVNVPDEVIQRLLDEE